MSFPVDRRTALRAAGAGAIMALLRSTYAAQLAGRPGSPPQSGFALQQTVTTLVPNRLYRIGCVVPAERLSWLPSDRPGVFEPMNAYLLIDDANCVFIDPGAPILVPALQQAIETLTQKRKVWVNFTRNEADCIGNMGYVFGSCTQPTLLFGGAGGILEWVNDPAVSILEVRDFLGRIPIIATPNGTQRDIGDLKLRWMDAALKQMLVTQWAFEASTGCLFTSDTMGYRHLDRADAPTVLDSTRRLPSVGTVADEIVCRINWLRESNYPQIIDRFERFFRDHDVQMIAPVRGCVLRGRDVVRAHVRLITRALHAASRRADTERLRYG